MKAEKRAGDSSIMIFEKWSSNNVEVQDPGLKRYICLKPLYLIHSGGRHEHRKFGKSDVNVVERFANNLMAGKKIKAINILRTTLEIIHLRTERNPIDVLVRAIENSAPCEETTRIGYGGIVYHRAVDISPQRRVDLALRFLAEGARKASFSNPKTIEECLADELIFASEGDSRSNAVRKKDETERVALSSR